MPWLITQSSVAGWGSMVPRTGNRRSTVGRNRGRASTATAIRRPRNPTRVTAMAGNTLRHTVPAKVPRATANSVYATGTMPCTSKKSQDSRLETEWFSGMNHQLSSSAYAVATATALAPTSPNLTSAQRATEEHPDQQRQEDEERAEEGEVLVLVVELLQLRPAGRALDRDELGPAELVQAVGKAGVDVRAVHLPAGGHHQRGQHGQPEDGEEQLLAVLAPGQPDHFGTPVSMRVGPGSAPADASAR